MSVDHVCRSCLSIMSVVHVCRPCRCEEALRRSNLEALRRSNLEALRRSNLVCCSQDCFAEPSLTFIPNKPLTFDSGPLKNFDHVCRPCRCEEALRRSNLEALRRSNLVCCSQDCFAKPPLTFISNKENMTPQITCLPASNVALNRAKSASTRAYQMIGEILKQERQDLQAEVEIMPLIDYEMRSCLKNCTPSLLTTLHL
jgi:hypothetical protein